ncbi:MAG: bifunctional (p)ppGpp synthetase/guanosine-3',5'-bis(diphosphate) 3'-pyrophosphohydrolase [Oscillospiraceae bacterium]|jgi:GTP pyrophosphokinase|nr:bifunctional (p)ppGpp synthetase/guanosine-3',5'-bis(diphosphate) 3'-pyrophosphohydrolase [Oscillospiraceae bacterium]
MEIMDLEYKELRDKIEGKFSQAEVAAIDKAYFLAAKAHSHQRRRSGQPYIIHPIAVAAILFNLAADAPSIQAALLHDVVEDTEMTLEDMKREFGETVATLVDGVTKLGKVPLAGLDREEEQAENLRKMLIAMSQDIRVIIIKLADRLHNMRTLSFVPEAKRRYTAKETLEFYAPIAHRLGIRPVKEELEDLAISYLDPIGYKEIEESLAAQSDSRSEFLENIKKRVGERVHEIVPDARIEGRIKSVHGIYRKMYIQNRNFDEIYDIYAVRVLVNTVTDCYNCLGLIHDMFRPIPGRFKDYISTPKPNMYQSLHSTLIGKEGIPFEVQIRTWEMHETAEFGIAAHWKYKVGRSADNKMDERLSWIRRFVENQENTEDSLDILHSIKNELVPDEVYVFTPKGAVINLPQGANVIDFAYAIHSEVGNRMIGAKVDGRIVTFEHQVKTGEIIEILTSGAQGRGPSRDWLKMVKTSEARSKIRMWFKREKRDENIVEGRGEFERELRRSNLHPDSEIMRELIEKVAEKQHFQNVNDFYAAIGYGGILLSRIIPHIREEYNKIIKAKPPGVEIKDIKHSSSEGVIVPNVENCLVKLSRCCSPIPGDEIIGFITRGHGISVHKRDCSNVPKAIENSPEPERWIEVYWDYDVKENFNATLLLKCTDDNKNLMGDIYSAIANMRLSLHALDYRENKGGGATVVMNITVNAVDHLWSIIARFNKIGGVLSVERTGT